MASEIMSFSNFTPDTQVVIATSEDRVGMSPNDVLKWLAPKAPIREAFKFLLFCKSAGLNPYLGEAQLIEMGGKWASVITKGGYLRRAQRHPDYDGSECGVVVQEQARDRTGKLLPGQRTGALIDLEGEIVPYGFFLVGGWGKVYRRGISRPSYARVSYSEYYKPNSPTWKQYPGTMIVKVGLTHAIKDAFAINDSYDEAEADDLRKNSPAQLAELRAVMAARMIPEGVTTPFVEAPRQLGNLYAGAEDPSLPVEMVEVIAKHRATIGIEDGEWIKIINKFSATPIDHVSELSMAEAETFIRKLEGIAAKRPVYEALPGVVQDPEPASVFAGAKPLDQEIKMEIRDDAGVMGNATEDDGQPGELVAAGVSSDGVPPGYAPLPTHDIED